MADHTHSSFFSDLLGTISERGRQWLKLPRDGRALDDTQPLIELCHALISGRGEASGAALAHEIFTRYARLDESAQIQFFNALYDDFGVDHNGLTHAMAQWQQHPSAQTSSELHFASEPKRQDLLRRLNRVQGGTFRLVQMRVDLLHHLTAHPHLRLVDRDFLHLLRSWFNRGFLVLRRIDWSTPANILEKIIRYEAVHTIHDWDELRRRIDPVDRRCYAFFHPALSDEPLIFVEVALTSEIPHAIAPLLTASRTIVPPTQARTAVFYSISNCQRGLDGVSFGHFLIKQVVEDLRRELPNIDRFVTLSPVTHFMRWLKTIKPLMDEPVQKAIETLNMPNWFTTTALADDTKALIEPLAAAYYLLGKDKRQRPIDNVARFHLGNGARLEHINWLGDRSLHALNDAAGLMVNYLYDLDAIETNHEAFANDGVISASSAVRKMLKSDIKARIEAGEPPVEK
jgi:malonyl-CoA decarboxylase